MLATTFAATDPATSVSPNVLSSRLDLREAARHKLAHVVHNAVESTPVFDIHTHLYAPAFGNLLLFGIDELLTYHYLVAETFRTLEIPYDAFWKMSKTQQADLVWNQLFLSRSPLSESCRGVLTTLHKLGLDVSKRDLPSLRKWFAAQKPNDYIAHCMEIANVRKICMTNSPFDGEETPTWNEYSGDTRFAAALRIDPLLMDWENTAKKLSSDGYKVQADLGAQTFAEVRRFLDDWATKMNPLYVMVSLPPDFNFPEDSNSENSSRSQIIENAILPFCRERNLPFALMLGVKKLINPNLQLAGDGVGRSDLQALQNLLVRFPDNKFLVTVLARENQHELAVLARKYRNLHIFGCWWFMNNPLLIDETTRMRMELLGLSFTPQHSDARVLDQIVYKWEHSRGIIAGVLLDKYTDLAVTGWTATPHEIERDVKELFGGGFESFLAQ